MENGYPLSNRELKEAMTIARRLSPNAEAGKKVFGKVYSKWKMRRAPEDVRTSFILLKTDLLSKLDLKYGPGWSTAQELRYRKYTIKARDEMMTLDDAR